MRGRSGKDSGVCACVCVKRWEGRERRTSKERERETGGSWRDIREGGIEEECVGGEERGGGRNRNTFFFSFLCSRYLNFVLFILFSSLCSKANTFSFCEKKTERKKKGEKELLCALSPAPAVPFPGFLSALTLLYSAYFLHVHLNSKSCLLSPPLSLSL